MFGEKKVDEKIRYRFGTHMLMAKEHTSFRYLYPKTTQVDHGNNIGAHSGLSREEMEVPLIVI